jgi:hypothetical protein
VPADIAGGHTNINDQGRRRQLQKHPRFCIFVWDGIEVNDQALLLTSVVHHFDRLCLWKTCDCDSQEVHDISDLGSIRRLVQISPMLDMLLLQSESYRLRAESSKASPKNAEITALANSMPERSNVQE